MAASAHAVTAPIKKGLWYRIKKNKTAYLFLIPILAFLGVFKYYTFFTAIVESFFQWNGSNINKFIWFENYVSYSRTLLSMPPC